MAEGKIGPALSLDGSSEWIEPYSPDNEFYHDTFTVKTIESWIRTNTTTTLQTVYDEGGSTNGFYVGVNSNNTVRAVTRDNSSQFDSTASYSDTVGFHYIVGVFNSGTLILYVDGDDGDEEQTQTTGYVGGEVSAHTGEPGIGYSPDSDAANSGPGEYFNGIIDEVRISNSARSADWIAAQYLSMNDGFITFGDEE